MKGKRSSPLRINRARATLLSVVLAASFWVLAGCSTPYGNALSLTRQGRNQYRKANPDRAFQKFCQGLYDLRKSVGDEEKIEPERRLLLAVLYHSLHRINGQKRYLKKNQSCPGLESLNAEYISRYPKSGVPLLQFAFQEVLVARELRNRLPEEEISSWVDVQTDLITGDQFYRTATGRDWPRHDIDVQEIVPEDVAKRIWKWALYRNAVEFYLFAWKYFPKVSARRLLGKPQERLRDAFGSISAVTEKLSSMDVMNEESKKELREISERFRRYATEVERRRNMSEFELRPDPLFRDLDPLAHRKRGRNAISEGQGVLDEGNRSESRKFYVRAVRHLAISYVAGKGYENLHTGRDHVQSLQQKTNIKNNVSRPLGDAMLNLYRLLSEE